MNAVLNSNPYNYANYSSFADRFGYGNFSAGAGNVAPSINPFTNPTDSVTLSTGAFNNDAPWALGGANVSAPAGANYSASLLNNDAPWAFDTQDVCECNFSHNAAQEAFIVPAGDQDNPYQNFNATALPLDAANGQDPQQALMALLTQLGITPEMVAALREMGVDLLSLIAEANGLESLGGVQSGQELVLPTTHNSNSGSASTNYYGGGTGNGNGSVAPVADYSEYVPAVEAPAAAPAPTPATGSGNAPHNGDSHDHVGDAGGHGRGHRSHHTGRRGGGNRIPLAV